MKALFDTNILIDYLNGIEAARDELGRYEWRLISLVSWMEVMVGAQGGDEPTVRGFLARFRCVGVDAEIAERAVVIRRNLRLKLPDAIVRATAARESALLITRNTKDFGADDPGVHMPYRLDP